MKKNLSAKLIALILVIAVAFSVAACKSKPVATPTPTPTPDLPVETPDESTPTPAAPLEQKTFKLGHLNSTAHLLGFVAEQEGFFAEEGLEAELLLFSSAGELVAALEAGQLDAAFIGSVPTITFQSQEHAISIFGGAMSNGHGYVGKPELFEGLDSWDITILKGKNVASVKNSVQDLELLQLLTAAGLTYGAEGEGKDVNVIYFDSQKDAFNALANEGIDAASAYSPYTSIAKNLGYEVIYYCNEESLFENQPCCRQVALTEALEAKPNTYAAFERAIIRAYKFSQEDKTKTIADVKAYIDIELTDIEFEVYGGHALSFPDPDKKATSELKAGVVDFGYTTDYNIEAHYNTSVYDTALAQLLAQSPNDAIYKELRAHFEANDK
ncbi:MAG: ABC transporter substrate-binding protein [Oscillospiraceae bacterium]|jgi:NitT/TauT family transport system substrate-binding protein|nr:ABC transporter substrate-binding protein [Oscillospiraceae bacterium]